MAIKAGAAGRRDIISQSCAVRAGVDLPHAAHALEAVHVQIELCGESGVILDPAYVRRLIAREGGCGHIAAKTWKSAM